jgi:SAM-dependent methyltransferase
MTHTDDDHLRLWEAEAREPFAGWDFAHITATGRMTELPLPWSYVSLVAPQLRQARSALDLGTGGGELLARMQPLPPDMHATEGYAPNIPIATARLAPLGVTVHGFEREGEPLPCADASMDLIIDRHEYYEPAEVWRALKPGGTFLTQQVGGRHLAALNAWLGAAPYPYAHVTLDPMARDLREQGFAITRAMEDYAATRFYDVGALVYYLRAIPWQVEGFTVARYRAPLLEMRHVMDRVGYIDFPGHHLLIEARKEHSV